MEEDIPKIRIFVFSFLVSVIPINTVRHSIRKQIHPLEYTVPVAKVIVPNRGDIVGGRRVWQEDS